MNVTNGANNHLTTTTGTALNITNTTIGASNVTFHDINSNGAANGIVLNNTGTSGHLTVTGTGTTAGTGGTIQNTTGDGVSLTDTQDVSLSNMTISDNAGSGINGLRVNGVVLTNLTLNSNADTQAEAGILFNELTGNASHATTFTNLNVSNSFTHNVEVINSGRHADQPCSQRQHVLERRLLQQRRQRLHFRFGGRRHCRYADDDDHREQQHLHRQQCLSRTGRDSRDRPVHRGQRRHRERAYRRNHRQHLQQPQ